jgi:serine phosphatase RsbU (regulator of sigma subunit)
VVERVARQGHAVLLRVADREPSMRTEGRITLLDPGRPSVPPTGFRMAAPLTFRDETFGMLHVQAEPESDAFDQADLDLLGGIAAQTAVALRLTKLHEQQRVQERIEKDLAIARQIQRNLLPREPPRVSGIDFAVHYEPAFRVGGDFYDFVWLDETHLGLVIGDVSGKAVSGALFMARVASEIRAQAALQREPRKILRRVNRAIAEATDDGVFCTALVMSIDLEHHVARIANAAHTLPLIGRDGMWMPIDDTDARSTPLGITPEADAGEVEIQLRPGDRILLYTDGLIEAALDDAGVLYGEQRLRDALARAGDGAKSVIETVLDDVDRFVGGTPQRDDQTLVCLHVKDSSSRRFGSSFPPAE